MKRYSKIPRIEVDGFVKRGKRYLNERERTRLITGPIYVEEKIDGKLVELEQEGYTLFYENVKRRHTVEYIQLPAWLIGIDIWDWNHFLDREEKEEVFRALEVPVAPLLFQGEVSDYQSLISLLGRASAYGADRIEGIVIKNPREQLMGKIVDPIFDRKVDLLGHHLRRAFVRNRLDLVYAYNKNYDLLKEDVPIEDISD